MKNIVIIEKLTDVISNKYEAVRVMAKEARRINNVLIRSASADVDLKPTSMALQRMLDHRIKYDFVVDEPIEVDLEEQEEE
jgi:DNA-directed RNA polymerase subunit K/omega